MSKAIYQTIEPKKPDFKDIKALIPYIAVFVGFLLVVSSVFLPLYKETDFGTSESYSVFKLAMNSVDDIPDFIDSVKASVKTESIPGVETSGGNVSIFIACLIDLVCVAACIVALIYVIKAILNFIHKNRLPCGGIAGICALEVVALVAYMLLMSYSIGFGGATFGSEVGIGAFVMAAGLIITSLGSKFLSNYVNKKSTKDMILSLSLVIIAGVLLIVTLSSMPLGIMEAENSFYNAKDTIDVSSDLDGNKGTISLAVAIFGSLFLFILMCTELAAVSPSIFADNDELFLGRRQIGMNNRPVDYFASISGTIAAFVFAVLTFVCVKINVNILNRGTDMLKPSSGFMVILIVAGICLAASIAIKVILKKSKTEQV